MAGAGLPRGRAALAVETAKETASRSRGNCPPRGTAPRMARADFRMSDASQEVQTIYGRRFAQNQAYRRKVWRPLTADFFQRLINPAGSVLDLGCGYGEFINQILAREKYGMDLNPDAAKMLAPGVKYF